MTERNIFREKARVAVRRNKANMKANAMIDRAAIIEDAARDLRNAIDAAHEKGETFTARISICCAELDRALGADASASRSLYPNLDEGAYQPDYDRPHPFDTPSALAAVPPAPPSIQEQEKVLEALRNAVFINDHGIPKAMVPIAVIDAAIAALEGKS